MAGFKGTNYFAQFEKAPQIIQGTPSYDVEVGDGINPPGSFFPAWYLPVKVSENRIGGSNYVIMPGKVITYDTNKRLVGAGLLLDKLNSQGSRTLKYAQKDVDAGVRNVANTGVVTSGNEIYTDMAAAGVDVIDAPIGYIRYSALQAAGTDPNDPSTFFKHNYDTGGSRAYSRRGYIQVPIIEVNARAELLTKDAREHRVALYTSAIGDNSGYTFYDVTNPASPVQKTLTLVATSAMTAPASGTVPTQYAVIGRTILFNYKIPAGWEVRYTPYVDTPFACLKVAYTNGKIIGSVSTGDTVASYGVKDVIGKTVGWNIDSNYQIYGSTGCSTTKIGRILDLKEGKSDALAMVRTYFRDFGLWQEGPGSATDGRNAILSVANAPKYIARIAVNFETVL
jgi:hypothetical protein